MLSIRKYYETFTLSVITKKIKQTQDVDLFFFLTVRDLAQIVGKSSLLCVQGKYLAHGFSDKCVYIIDINRPLNHFSIHLNRIPSPCQEGGNKFLNNT